MLSIELFAEWLRKPAGFPAFDSESCSFDYLFDLLDDVRLSCHIWLEHGVCALDFRTTAKPLADVLRRAALHGSLRRSHGSVAHGSVARGSRDWKHSMHTNARRRTTVSPR